MASDGETSCTNDPNFAVIYSFLKVFGKLYALEVPTLTKLQELIENTEEVLDPLKELHLRLLRRALKSVQSNRWERCLIKFCHQRGHHQEAWEIERFSYKKASTQIKLRVLKILLEYQFTCHPKFKSAVNALPNNELRLDPIGRDKNGCVYWLQVDDEANLCLYKEDQDEETWQLIARTRQELVKVISQLKKGEEICPLEPLNVNEDSSSAEIPPQSEAEKSEVDENEEFLSPESESEHEDDEEKVESKNEENNEIKEVTVETETKKDEDSERSAPPDETIKTFEESTNEKEKEVDLKEQEQQPPDSKEESKEAVSDAIEECKETVSETVEECKETVSEAVEENKEPVSEVVVDSKETVSATIEKCEETKIEMAEECIETVSEAVEEPVIVITGEGNGADCESSFFISEEITEPVMYFYGEGYGYDNDTGNPEAIEQANSGKENSDEENGNEECVNGELSNSSSKTRLSKTIQLRSNVTINKRALKKQSNDTSEILRPDTKKPCVRDIDKPDTSNSNTTSTERELKREDSVNDKSNTDSEGPTKNNAKKTRNRMKKQLEAKKLKSSEEKEILKYVPETDSCNDNKSCIIEKRKSSVSSENQDDAANSEHEKQNSPDLDVKAEDDLPPKKLRLETTPESDITGSHSKETVDAIDNVHTENKDSLENNPIAKRKKIKANKDKSKRKKRLQNRIGDSESGRNDKTIAVNNKRVSKSLKRSLLDANQSDKSKSESQSESEDDEPVTSGKRLKIKPKKTMKSRKKVEAKLKEANSTDESEEETLYSLASNKKTVKKVLKKKSKGKEKEKEKSKARSPSVDSETPVRQSRRIAQMKIKEEADRRHLEEVALRELKMIHKKKTKDEEEWQASGHSSSDSEVKAKKLSQKWKASDSTGPEPDTDTDEPLFEHYEPDLEFSKSDHEFSPESDLESGEPVEPLKRARTLQEVEDTSGGCMRCGSGEQPEWILLCDGCDAGYHASCLKPMLLLVPVGDWYCPPCNHEKLIASLESELAKYDELYAAVQEERARRKELEPEVVIEEEKEKGDSKDKAESDGSGSGSEYSTSSSEGAVYRLRARKQLPVSYRAREYDRLISSAIKEEYVEPTTSAGNQGRGKDISTIIEAAEEEKLKAEREALEQGQEVEVKKTKKKQRRKPRKLNSLDVPSEDDDETDEDFKDTGMESTSEEISSSAERDSSNDSRSSDDLPIRRTGRSDQKKDRPKLAESSPEAKKKKKGVFNETSSESSGAKEWPKSSKSKSKHKRSKTKKSEKSHKARKKRGLTQYDADGNVVRSRVTYGGLSGTDEPNDWSPKHRTRQKVINYTETPNTESEDEMHKSSGKHMPDSSDEFKIDDSDVTSDSECERNKRQKAAADESADEQTKRAICDLIKKTAVVPLEKLPEDVTKAKTEELQAHLNAQAVNARPLRGRGSRGGRGSRSGRGRGGSRGAEPASDDALAKLVGVKIKDLRDDASPLRPNQVEREKKRQEREAKLAEKEAKRLERLQKKEEKEKMKEQKAKEREEKRLARIALQESKRVKKEKPEFSPMGPMGYGVPRQPLGQDMSRMNMYGGMQIRHPVDMPEQAPRFPQAPRLQVRAELRGALGPRERPLAPGLRPELAANMREGTLSVAGSPQPFKPISEEPSVITRMPHIMNQQYRGPMMYPPGNSPYGPRGPQNMAMYQLHSGMNPHQGMRHQYPPQGYYPPHLRGLPPGYSGSMRPGPPTVNPNGPPPHGQGSSSLGQGPPGLHQGPQGPHGQGPPRPHVQGPPIPHGQGPPVPHEQGPPGPLVTTHGPHGPIATPGPSHGQHGPIGSHVLPHSLGTPGFSHGQSRGLTSSPHGPVSSPHGPIASPHGPVASAHGSIASPHGPHGPILGPLHSRGPTSSPHGPSVSSPHGPSVSSPHGPPVHPMHGPPTSSPHGPIPSSHGPGLPPNSQLIGPHGPIPHPSLGPGHLQRPPGMLGSRPILLNPTPRPRTPVPNNGTPQPPPSTSPADHDKEPPIKIKTEVKTEPEYNSPPQSPNRPISPQEVPRHPKIKHTENKDRRPRFPLGPYAPQYGPYGPYAPPVEHSPLMNLQARLQAPNIPRMHNIQQFLPMDKERERPNESIQPLNPYLPTIQQHLRPPIRPYMMMPRQPPDRTSPQRIQPQIPPHFSAAQFDKPPTTHPQQFPPNSSPIQMTNQKPNSPQPIERNNPERPPNPPTAPPQEKDIENGSNETPEKPIPYIKTEILNNDEIYIKSEVRVPVREEGSVFGGLVSYFSSQREDDIDT